MTPTDNTWQLSNAAYTATVTLADGLVHIHLHDKRQDLAIADGPYVYRAGRATAEGQALSTRLMETAVRVDGDTIVITGSLAGLEVEHRLSLPADRLILEERLRLRNSAAEPAALEQLACGFQRPITTDMAALLP